MKVVTELAQREVPQMDEEAINKRKQKRHAKVIDDEDKGLNSFGIAKNVEKTMKEKQQLHGKPH